MPDADATPRVRLVVLNYNGVDLTQRCVDHLLDLDWPPERLEIVVIDNASTDGSVAALEARLPAIRLIESGHNAGFPANNLGLRDLDGTDFVGLVNNDAFVDRDWLRHLVDLLQSDPELGAACPKILLAPQFVDVVVTCAPWRAPGDGRDLGVQVRGLFVDSRDVRDEVGWASGCYDEEGDGDQRFRWLGPRAQIRLPVEPGKPAPERIVLELASPHPTTVQVEAGGSPSSAEVAATTTLEVALAGEPYDVINNVGSVLMVGGWGADRGFLQPDRGQFETEEDVFAWCGAGVLFRPEVLADVGLFDERFFMYYEDTDLSWRGRARGWRYRYTPSATMRHIHAASSVEGSPMFQHFVERNRLCMLLKNAPADLLRRSILDFVTATASYAVRDIVKPILRGRRPSPRVVRARARSFVDFLRLVPGLYADRRRIRGRQTVDDASLLRWAAPR